MNLSTKLYEKKSETIDDKFYIDGGISDLISFMR